MTGLGTLGAPDLQTLSVPALERLRSLQEAGQPDVLRELVDLFLSEASGWLAALREADLRRETALMVRAAHSLRGACGSIGAERMRHLARELERGGGTRPWRELTMLIDALDREFERLRRRLRDYLNAQGGPGPR